MINPYGEQTYVQSCIYAQHKLIFTVSLKFSRHKYCSKIVNRLKIQSIGGLGNTATLSAIHFRGCEHANDHVRSGSRLLLLLISLNPFKLDLG